MSQDSENDAPQTRTSTENLIKPMVFEDLLERVGDTLEAKWAILRRLGAILERLGGSWRHHVGQDEQR